MGKKGLRSFALAGIASFLSFLVTAGLVDAQTGMPQSEPDTAAPQTAESLIARPARPATKYTLDSGDTGTNYVTKLAPLFAQTISGLQTNLLALRQLDNASNQAAMNALGKSYGGADQLGDHLQAAISGMDLGQLKSDTDILSSNISSSLAQYSDTIANFNRNFSSDISNMLQNLDARKLGANSDPSVAESNSDPSVAEEDTDVDHLDSKAKESLSGKMEALKKLTGQFKQFISLNDSISELNSNLESVARTYGQMLAAGSRPPSELVAMTDLASQLGEFNSLAESQLRILDSLHGELSMVNAKFEALNRAGGISAINNPQNSAQASQALADVSATLDAFAAHIAGANQQMAAFLGTPSDPALATGQNGESFPPMSNDMRAVIQAVRSESPSPPAAEIPQIDPSQIPAQVYPPVDSPPPPSAP